MLKSNFIKSSVLITCFSLSAQAGIGQFYTLTSLGSGAKLVANDVDYNKSFSEVAADVDKFGLKSSTINIIVIPESDNASYDNGEIIKIPRTMVIKDFYGGNDEYKDTMQTLAVFAHEYAHTIFEIYAGEALPGYSKMKEIATEISRRSIRPAITVMTPEEITANRTQIAALTAQLGSNPVLMKQRNLMSPYNELFADTVSVFLNDKKNIIMNALYPPSSGNIIHDRIVIKSAEARNFDQKRDVNTWEDYSPHNYFSPLRSVIGSKQCWPVTEADKAKKLKYLLTLLLNDIKDQIKTNDADATNIVEKMVADNKRLIHKYKKICK